MTWDFSLGNLITILLGILGLAVAWGRWQSDSATLRKQVDSQGKRLDTITEKGCALGSREHVITSDTLRDHEDRLRRIETHLSKIDVIAIDIQWIKRQLEKLASRDEGP